MLKSSSFVFEPTDDKCVTGINDFDVRQPVMLFSTSNDVYWFIAQTFIIREQICAGLC